MKIITMEKGRALAIAAVWSASSPPATSSTAAMAPLLTAQNTRCQSGGLSAAPEVIMSITSAPESAEVTKKKITSSVASPEAIMPNGRCPSISNRATGMLSLTICASGTAPARSISMAVLPNTVIQKKVNSTGTSSTPVTNSRMVRPREIRAMNMPTKGDHAIYQPQ
ncbi:hypothetical protein M2440_002092 [Methylorubrum extorquens]|nr:hypothetical protein [Methylorubrum extorquens]